MKGLLAYALLAVVVAEVTQLLERDEGDDDDCEMVWVTIYTDIPTASTIIPQSAASTGGSASNNTLSSATSSASISIDTGIVDILNAHNKVALPPEDTTTGEVTSVTEASSSPIAENPLASSTSGTSESAAASESTSSPKSTSDSSSVLNIPKRPDGSAPIPINDNHLSAPVAKDPVPAGAAIYTPVTAGIFNNTDFAAWMKRQKDKKLATKWMKVAPGTYRYAPGPVMPEGTDANTVIGENIAIYFTTGGWTLDLRGVTFYIDITPENKNQRPGDIIYINQSEDFTLLGGTVWIDQGEQFTQARVKSISAADSDGNQVATMEVEQGYNVSAWKDAGPRNLACVDDSDPNHYGRPECNFWYASKYDFSNLESKRTFTAQIASRSNIEEGYVITMILIVNSLTAISTENNGNFHVKGFTSNGYVGSIGLSGKVPPTYEDVYYVNPPPRPGYAPRITGPAVSWGNIGGFIYNAPGQEEAKLPGSYWQTTGCEKDLQAAANNTVLA